MRNHVFRIWVCSDRYKVARHFQGLDNNILQLPDLVFADMFVKSIEDDLRFQIKSKVDECGLFKDGVSILCCSDMGDVDEYNNHLWSCRKVVPRELKKIINESIDWQMNMIEEVIGTTEKIGV